MSATIAVLDYGSGNLHSVSRALAHVGADVRVADRPDDGAGDAVLIPGVGHFGQCARDLRGAGFEAPIRKAADEGRPLIGVCVGMQILFEASEEDDEPGLGILPGVGRRPAGTRAGPPMCWHTRARAGA